MAATTQEKPKTTIPEYHRDPVGYLESHGWTCDSAEPWRDEARWFDPTKPKEAKRTRVQMVELDAARKPIIGPDGKPMPRYVRDSETGKPIPDAKGHLQPLYQWVIEPEAWPMKRGEAVKCQLERDAK